jgi:hypothetical protein
LELVFKLLETGMCIGNNLKLPRTIVKWFVSGHVLVMSEEKNRDQKKPKSKNKMGLDRKE